MVSLALWLVFHMFAWIVRWLHSDRRSIWSIMGHRWKHVPISPTNVTDSCPKLLFSFPEASISLNQESLPPFIADNTPHFQRRKTNHLTKFLRAYVIGSQKMFKVFAPIGLYAVQNRLNELNNHTVYPYFTNFCPRRLFKTALISSEVGCQEDAPLSWFRTLTIFYADLIGFLTSLGLWHRYRLPPPFIGHVMRRKRPSEIRNGFNHLPALPFPWLTWWHLEKYLALIGVT